MNIRIPLISLSLSLVFNLTAKAQQDTSVYQLGSVNLPKKFTQSVTVKATELEKIPFTNINDVITAWLYGYYGDKKSYIYVVDGNLNTDVNALSVFDIEEITMVQNASIYVNGALPGQVLLLVKTKRNISGSSGVNFNGQTNLVNLRDNYSSAGSTKNLYQHYYLSTYKHTRKISAGLSATFQHNVFPASKFTTIADKAYNADRFKLNGYFDAQLGNANSLSLTAGYMPQNDDVAVMQRTILAQGVVTTASNGNASQNLLYANIGLVSKISAGISNKLNVGYQTRKTNINLSQNQIADYYYNGGGGYSTNTITKTDSSGRAGSFLINDDLSYNLRLSKLSIQPNVNFTYKKITDNTSYHGDYATSAPPATYAFNRSQNSKTSLTLLTPSVTLNYDDVVVLQGGFQKPLNNDIYATYKIKQTDMMPFASVGVDVLKVAGSINKNVSLLFSGSYARALTITAEPYMTQSDQIMLFANTARYPYNQSVDFKKVFDQFQAGLSFGMLQNRLTLSYNYQLVKTADFFTAATFYSPSFTYYENFQYDRQTHINRFEVNAEVISNVNFKWRSAFNISVFKDNGSASTPGFSQIILSLPKRNLVTGGMINRFVYKKISARLDVLYCFNQERYGGSLSSIPGNKYYSINLQNIYVGYGLKAHNQKNIEVYANSRNMLMTNASTITDNRRFYGVGFKADL